MDDEWIGGLSIHQAAGDEARLPSVFLPHPRGEHECSARALGNPAAVRRSLARSPFNVCHSLTVLILLLRLSVYYPWLAGWLAGHESYKRPTVFRACPLMVITALCKPPPKSVGYIRPCQRPEMT